jgi:hypothetical protein
VRPCCRGFLSIISGLAAKLLAAHPDQPNNGSEPRAYLNWTLLDGLPRCAAIGEQFKYVPSGSGFIRVGWYNDRRLQTLAQNGLPVAKSGYLFVYVSHERAENQPGDKPFACQAVGMVL